MRHLFGKSLAEKPATKSRPQTHLARLAGQAVDLVLPRLCPGCKGHLSGPGLCGQCWTGLQAIMDPFCRRCGRALAYALADNLCLSCHLSPPPLDRIRAGFVYNDASRRLILPFKHGDRLDLGPVMAHLLAPVFARMLEPEMMVLPVPLHRRRYFRRRYNQSAELARLLCARTDKGQMACGLLRRTRPTRQMGGLGMAARARNVKNAFAVCQPLLAGQPILLIDDVMTTGATLHEAARALKKAGAGPVAALVFARVG